MQVRDGQKKLLLDACLDPIRGSAEECQPGFRVLHLNVFHALWEHRRAQDQVQTRSRSIPHQKGQAHACQTRIRKEKDKKQQSESRGESVFCQLSFQLWRGKQRTFYLELLFFRATILHAAIKV